METVLVTGGCGYIGSHNCVSLLGNNHNVLVIDSLINSSIISLERVCEIMNLKGKLNKEGIFFANGDLRDKNFLREVFEKSKSKGKPINGVIHFAGLKAVNESLKFPLLHEHK